MEKTIWEGHYPVELRNNIIYTCKLAGVDFEKDFITDGHASNDATSAESSPLMTREMAAKYVLCSTDTIDNWIKNGFIKCFKTSNSRPSAVRIFKDSLIQFIKNNPSKIKKAECSQVPFVKGGCNA